ncbi:hypothetical protein PMIN06_009697 [Paraphaeosphaeria minitans]
MTSSDDLAEQQIFAEIQASVKKVQHHAHEPPSSSAILSASLLNAARLDRRPTVAAAPSYSHSHTSHGLPQSGPVGANRMARASGVGKLKPVGFLHEDRAKQPRRDLARRGDLYELGFSSPEKTAVRPPAKARQKPSDEKTKGRVQRHVSPEFEAHAPLTPPETEETTREAPAVSPSVPRTHGNHFEKVPEMSTETSKVLPSDPFKEPGQELLPSKRKPRKQAQKTGRPAKSTRKGSAEDETGKAGQSKSRDGPHRAKSPQVVISSAYPHVRSTWAANAKQAGTYPPEHYHQAEPPQSAQKPPEQDLEIRKPQPPKRRKITRLKPSKLMTGLDIQFDSEVDTIESSRPTKQAQHEPQPRELASRPRKDNLPQASKKFGYSEIRSGPKDGNSEGAATRQTRSKTATKPNDPVSVSTTHSERSKRDTSQRHRPQKSNKAALNTADNVQNEPDMEEEDDPDRVATEVDEAEQSSDEDISDGEDDEAREDDEDREHDHNAQYPGMDMVFKFLESAEHSGNCRTEDAMAVKDACRIALDLLADPESTLDEVSITTKNIQKSLSKYGAGSDDKQRKSLKIDAYAYLFRQVVSYLKSLYDWLLQKYRVFESSLDAMRIVAPLVNAIVLFNDRVAAWRISIPTRYKGVRLIKDVEIHLIVPLRKLSQAYVTILCNLKDQAWKRRAYEELEQETREREQNEEEKQEMEALRIEKLNDWIELHVCRLRIEPSAHRRHALSMRHEYFDKKVAKWTDEEAEGQEERDANGVLFSRVDLFKKRVVPPVSPCPDDDEKEWTDEQMKALIYGLQNFAGPCVFQKIFEHFCGVGQPLRRFGVPEITAKAADVKVRLLRTYEEREWKEVPKWIQKIPILP